MSQEFLNQLQTILNTALGIFQVVATFVVAFLVVLWLTLCVWTFRDIQSRTRDVIAQVFATLLVLFFNIPGVLLYILVRPKETLVQAYERSLQEEYMLQDLEEREICPTCRVKTQPDFAFCFNCRTRLRRECPTCGHLVKVKWASCPFCGTPQKARPRDASSDRAGLGAPQTYPPRPRPQGQPVGSTALATTGDPNANLASTATYAPPSGPVYSNIPTSPAPEVAPQTYADGGDTYGAPTEQIYTYREEDTYDPENEATARLDGNNPALDQNTTGRYKPPRQRRTRNPQLGDDSEAE